MIYRSHLLMLTLIVVSTIHAESPQSILAKTLTIFGEAETPPVILDSSRGWTTIAVINWDSIADNSHKNKSPRIWRLCSRYEYQGSGGPVTLQIRIRNPIGTSLFTHEWTQSVQKENNSYSNWFEDTRRLVDSSERSIVEAKLIAPPRIPLQSTLYAVSMEAWEVQPKSIKPNYEASSVQLAHTQSPEAVHPDSNNNSLPLINSNSGPQAAMEFSLAFIDSCITGDLSEYYRSQNDVIHILDDGSSRQKYRLPLPAGIPDISTIQDYKKHFSYKVYSLEDYSDMFPEWFDINREWVPKIDMYLFMGHENNIPQDDLSGVDFLVFIVGIDTNNEWKVLARPEP